MNFLNSIKKTINSGQSRSIVLYGNVYDLFFDGEKYVNLISFLSSQLTVDYDQLNSKKGITQALFELNNPIRIHGKSRSEIFDIWRKSYEDCLEKRLNQSAENTTYSLELLSQIVRCNRQSQNSKNDFLVLIESADLILPESEISKMSANDRKRLSIVHDWFSDTSFIEGSDTVIMISESRSSLHSRIAKLPQLISIEIPLPDLNSRMNYIEYLSGKNKSISNSIQNSQKTVRNLAENTSGLSLHAIRQLMFSEDFSNDNINKKVEEYMIGQLGDGVVEFSRPNHKFEDIIGFSNVKQFMKDELIPGFLDGTINGAAVSGPIGGGKTFICEALAAELDVPVMMLKGIRSMFLGETDKIIDRLWRLLLSFNKICIFVDEADTQFGGLGKDVHETEKRLTGKIQSMMSDSRLKGKVIWFLMTARIEKLSPDIKRAGRIDIIIPILDPEGEDLTSFINWTFEGIEIKNHEYNIKECVLGYSSANFALLKKMIKSKKCTTAEEAIKIANQIVQPDIEEERKYQKYQAILNCSRISLLNCSTRNQFYSLRNEAKNNLKKLKVD